MASGFEGFIANINNDLNSVGQGIAKMFGVNAPDRSNPIVLPVDQTPGVTSRSPIAPAQPNPYATGGPTIYANLEQQYRLPPGYLSKVAQIESGGDPNAHNPSGAAGLFQFMPATAKGYGLSDPYDPVASSMAAARLANDNLNTLSKALGREPTAGELYLAHQQGAGGASALLANPTAKASSIVGASAVQQNGGTVDMTAQEFADKWVSKVDGRPEGPAAGMPWAQDHSASSMGGSPSTGSQSYANMPDMPTFDAKADKKSLMWGMLGQGLSQMSSGDRVDVSSVIQMHHDRQLEAQNRIAEIMQERQRRDERLQNRDWTVQDHQQAVQDQRELSVQQAQMDLDAARVKEGFVTARTDKERATAVADATRIGGSMTDAITKMGAVPSFVETMKSLPPELQVKVGNDYIQAQVARDTAKQAKIAADALTSAENLKAADALLKAADPSSPQFPAIKAMSDAVRADPMLDPKAALDAAKTATPAGPSTVINTGAALETEIGKSNIATYAKRSEDLHAFSDTMANTQEAVRAARQAMADGTMTGAGQGAVLQMRQVAQGLGMSTTEMDTAIQNQSLIQAVGNRMQSLLRTPGIGSQSDKEFANLLASTPGLQQSPDFNKLVLQGFDNAATARAAMGAELDQWRSVPENIKSGNFDKHWNDLVDAGKAPATIYTLDSGSSSDANRMVAAFTNGFLKPGDLVVLDHEGKTDYVPVDQAWIDKIKSTLAGAQ